MNKLVTDKQIIRRTILRRIEPAGIFPSEEEAVNLLQIKSRRIYLGIDPTGPEIHIGHTIPLLYLKGLWEIGHRPVIVIGDFTAKIGDPTGKDTTRRPLSDKEIKNNFRNYMSQICKILPKGSFEVEYNSSWLSKITLKDFIELASHATVQQMLQRDMFQERMRSQKSIGLHEFLYPLMQGYDSVFMEIDGEVGGNDQTFNMLVGRDLEKKLLNKNKLVFATQILVNENTGKKMSKSEGDLISLSDSSKDMFGKTMKIIPDGFIFGMFKLCTEKSEEWLKENNKGKIESSPNQFKKELAFELVRMYYGGKEAQKAKEEWERVFTDRELPMDIQEYAGDGKDIINVIIGAGLVESKSKSEAKRLIDQKAVRVNSEIVQDWEYQIKSGDIIKVGPRKFIKII